MSSMNFLVVSFVALTWVLIFFGYFRTADAIQCYECQDPAATCQGYETMKSCSPALQFCILQYTAATGIANQACASSGDCPAGSGNDRYRRQATNNTGANAVDILNCCNYDGCNCIGTQCIKVVSKASHAAALSVLVLSATVMAGFLA